uniref:BTB domain-containing protein n=1 Tax=Plectus sambesii TaxID=2011161 RepID=A0A914UYV2_9BILA
MDRKPEHSETISTLVTLNVGGKLFTTRTSTLVQSDFFARMFNKNWMERMNESGSERLFIDRNPNIFQFVLDFLRGSFVLPENDQLRQKILTEADYFGIASMITYLNAKIADDKLILVTIGDCPSRNVPRSFILQARANGFHELFRLYKQNYELVVDDTESMEIQVNRPNDRIWMACLSVALFGKYGLTNQKALQSSIIGLLPIELHIAAYQLGRDMHMPIDVIKILNSRLKQA